MQTSSQSNLRTSLAAYEREAGRVICPIYGVTGNIGGPIGSGFLLKLSSGTLLVTAAHVLAQDSRVSLQIPGATRAVPIVGTIWSTGRREPTESEDFGLDVAFVLLDVDRMIEPPRTPAITATDLDPNDRPQQGIAYGFAGIPAIKNRPRQGQFPGNGLCIGGEAASTSLYVDLQFNPDTHFLMTFPRDNMIDESGRTITAPQPYGMSGGPVFRYGSFDEIERSAASPKVIGVGIEWRKRHRMLIGVRIALFIESIREILPASSDELPHSEHIRTAIGFAADANRVDDTA